MSRNVSINLYLRPFSFVIYGKFYLSFLYYSRLFWSVNFTKLVFKDTVQDQTGLKLCQAAQRLFILEVLVCI